MPDPAPNPYDSDPHLGMKAVGWAECDEAWRAWLASDEAVERVARAMVDQLPGGPWRWQLTTADLGKARAVLAALRGDGDA